MDECIDFGKKLLPKGLTKNFGTVLAAINVAQTLKNQLYPEYTDVKRAQDFQIESPNQWSCIYNGSEEQEYIKRRSFKIRQSSLEEIIRFLEHYDFTQMPDNQLIMQEFYNETHQCSIIDLKQIQFLPPNLNGSKSKEQQLNSVLDELALLLFEYYKGEFMKENLACEFLIHYPEIQDAIYQQIKKYAKKQFKNIFNKLEIQVKKYYNQQKDNLHLQELCKIIQLKQLSLQQCSLLINNFFTQTNQLFCDSLIDIQGFQISDIILQKYLLKTREYYLHKIRDSLHPYYIIQDETYEAIETKCQYLFTQYFIQGQFDEGIKNPEINAQLTHIINQIKWTEEQCILVKEMQNKLKTIARRSNQIQNKNQSQFQISMNYWKDNISEADNILIIFQLYILISGIEFKDDQLEITQYNPKNRQLLIKIIRSLNNGKYNYLNILIIKICEQITAKIQQQIYTSIGQKQIGQNESITIQLYFEQMSIQLFNKSIKNQVQIQQEYFTRNQFLYILYQPIESGQDFMKRLAANQKTFLDNKLKYIHSEFLKDQSPPEYLLFELLSKPNTPSNIVTICISGFVSEEEDKYSQWKDLIQKGSSTIVALHWKCSTLTEFGKFFLKNIATSIVTKASLNTLGALMTVISAYSENPFTEAEKEAIKVGRYLGYLIAETKIFGDCQVNIVSHSLGTQLVYECVKEMDKIYLKNPICFVNSIIMMGGVADVRKLQKRRWHSVAGDIFNIYSKNDDILTYLLTIIKIFHRPCGKQKIFLGYREVKNCNFGEFINGHVYYKKQLTQILKQTDFDNDFKYLFEGIENLF